MVGKQQSVDLPPFLFIALAPMCMFPGLELPFLRCSDVSRRFDIEEFAGFWSHFVDRELSRIAEGLLAPLAMDLVMPTIQVLPT